MELADLLDRLEVEVYQYNRWGRLPDREPIEVLRARIVLLFLQQGLQ